MYARTGEEPMQGAFMDMVDVVKEEPKKDRKPLEQRVKSFGFRLKKEYPEEIKNDPSRFNARVVGTLKAVLPRQRPGRKGSPEVKQAAELYLNLYASKGVPGDWHALTKRLVPGYANLSPEMQRYHRFRLRSQTHSYLYDQRSRLRRSARNRCGGEGSASV
jgi:hypothetical protein